jgi:Undecaprenyl-phosphate glucose phosphotransferase
MSEVSRDRDPHDERARAFSRHVEAAAAASFAGQLSHPTTNVYPFTRIRSQPAPITRRSVSNRDLQTPIHMVADALFIVAVSFVIGLPFMEAGDLALSSVGANFWNSLAIAMMTLVLERATTRVAGLGMTDRSARFRRAIRTWTYGIAGYLFCVFAFKSSGDLSRGYLVCIYLFGLVAFGFWRSLAAPAVARIGQMIGSTTDELVILGDTGRVGVRQFVDELRSGGAGTCLVRFAPDCSDAEWPEEQRRILDEACQGLRGTKDAALYLCSAGLSMARLEALCDSLSILPVATYIVPDPATAGLARCRAFVAGNRVAFELRRPPMNRAQLILKRTVDILVGSLALIVLSPVMIGAAIAIRLDSKGPVFFIQQRTGKSGQKFNIVKFRSMYVLEDGPAIQQASRNDPRVTRAGRFLRSSSIDELPQLFNVLRGEMSLVGPRPHAVAHDQHYAKEVANYELRQHVKPGITGWAQVNGLRGETADVALMHRRIEFDIWYALHPSILLDFEIMARTIITLFVQRNAY